MPTVELLSEVAVLRDIPEQRVMRGQVGTVVEVLSPSVVEVEFSDDEGRTYAMASLPNEDVVVLHHRPLEHTA